jgi:phosphate transport system permease protein
MTTSANVARGAAPRRTQPRESSATWPLLDRLGLAACWATGLFLTAVAVGIVVFMAVKGVQYLKLDLLFQHPSVGADQSQSGGYLDPIEGTIAITLLGIAIAGPIGVGIAIWLAEYGRPAGLARAVESGVDVIAGVPSIVLAIFGLIVFTQPIFSGLSVSAQGVAAFGRSFFIAGIVMSLIALPLMVGSTREALLAIPSHVREASYALGKNQWTTIRYVLLPAVRPGIATGAALGMGRIIGDTAIAIVLLGATLRNQAGSGPWPFDFLQGTGSTLTTYVYNNSPVGEGNAHQKAYAAAFILLLVVIGLNYIVDRLTRGGREVTAWSR